jgi:hypothetical protein
MSSDGTDSPYKRGAAGSKPAAPTVLAGQRLSDCIAAGIADGDFAPADVGMLSGFVLSGLHDALVSALHAGDADMRHCVTGAKELTRRLLTLSPAH